MTLLVRSIERAMRPQAIQFPGPNDDWTQWQSAGIGWLSQAGITVTPQTAMMVSAIWACVRVITETIAGIPLPVYERVGDEKRRAQTLHLYDLLHDSPNDRQTSFAWREMLTGHACLRGNGLSEIVREGREPVGQLVPIHPSMVRVDTTDDGMLRYWKKNPDGTEAKRPLLEDEVFHLRGLSDNGVLGMSVISMARESIGLARAAEEHGARTFENGPRLSGVLQHPGRISPDAAKGIRESWQSTYGGAANAGKVAVLWEDMKWQAIGMSNEDAQFLSTRQFQVEECARWFRMPLHMIGHTEKQTTWGTGVEQMTIGFVIFTMLPWARRWEQQISKSLIADPKRYFAEFLFDGLLRGDLKSRYEAYAIAVQWGWMTRNEVRRLENMNPVDGLDDVLTPLNMAIGNPPRPLAPAKAAAALMQGDDVRAIAPPETQEGNDLLGLLAKESAQRMVRMEIDRIRKAGQRYASDGDGFKRWLAEFYSGHAENLTRTLHVSEQAAKFYADEQRGQVEREGLAVVGSWGWRADHLAGLMLGSA